MEESKDNPVVCGPKEKGKKHSLVWYHFEKKIKPNSEIIEKENCKYCVIVYAHVSDNGTSTLKTHAIKCLKNPFNKQGTKKQNSITFGLITEEGGSKNSLGLWKFDQDACRGSLAKMIIMDELPFKFVDPSSKNYHAFQWQGIVSKYTLMRKRI